MATKIFCFLMLLGLSASAATATIFPQCSQAPIASLLPPYLSPAVSSVTTTTTCASKPCCLLSATAVSSIQPTGCIELCCLFATTTTIQPTSCCLPPAISSIQPTSNIELCCLFTTATATTIQPAS
ncbi:Z1A alpha zein protein [Zea mays]|uniref:Z1A alpha zein protein n=1 Tax=Zea mays TaxID=4577 RepID=A0A1D6PVL5_MAIZE|nr:Z1A alpha zein protein [Zea mays]